MQESGREGGRWEGGGRWGGGGAEGGRCGGGGEEEGRGDERRGGGGEMGGGEREETYSHELRRRIRQRLHEESFTLLQHSRNCLPRSLFPYWSSLGENVARPKSPGTTTMIPPATPDFAGSPTLNANSPE